MSRLLFKYIWFSTIFISTNTIVHGQKKYSQYYDGPYIFQDGEHTDISWVERGKLKNNIYIGDSLVLNEEQLEAPNIDGRDIQYYKDLADQKLTPDHQVVYENISKVAAISDVHGQYDLMLTLLRENEIVNEHGNWSYGDGHLVITGDIFDRGDRVIDIVWYLIRLEKQAAQAGGKVHTLIGNHEWMVLSADIRYIHKKYRYTSALFKKPYNKLFGHDSFLGSWIRSKPVYIKVNGMAFVHGGISEELFNYMSIDDLNKTYYDKVLMADKDQDDEKEDDELTIFLKDINGPLWYRGYAYEDEYDKSRTDKLLKLLDAKRIIVGHTSMAHIMSIHNNKIIFIDASIKLGEGGEILLVNNKKLYRADQYGKRTRL